VGRREKPIARNFGRDRGIRTCGGVLHSRVETLKDTGEGLSSGVRGAGQLEVPQRQWLGLPEHGEEAAGGGGGGAAPSLLGVLRLELRVGRPSATAFGRMGVCAGAPH